LESKFHQYFYSGLVEKNIGDLIEVRQERNEFGGHYLQRLREVRNQCYSLTLSDEELICIAICGLQPTLKEKVFGIEYQSLGMLANRIASIEAQIRFSTPRNSRPQKTGNVETNNYYVSSDEEDEEVAAIE
jgi:hypothetical protein